LETEEHAMIEPAFPPDEEARLAELRALDLLDTAAEREFDDIVAIARAHFKVPIALVSLIDAQRQWFKAGVGLDAAETPRDISFCAHAIHRSGPLVVPDATLDPRFHDNPAVQGGPHVRFYAGQPLALPSGHRIGTLCVIGREARDDLDADALAVLAALGRLVLDAIALRTARARHGRSG
jgi:GAF domain-containing protein